MAHTARSEVSSAELTHAVEPLLQQAMEQGDAAAFRARTFVGLLALVQTVTMHWAGLRDLQTKYLVVTATLVFGISVPYFVRRMTQRMLAVDTHAMLSVSGDALFVTLVLMPMVLWPHADYRGCLREVDVGFFALAVVASAIRLSRTAVFVSLAANVAGLATLLAFDDQIAGGPMHYRPANLFVMGVLMSGSGLLAWLSASRTRSLVYAGARAVLLEERARQRLGVYVSEEVATEALKGGRLELGGERRELAVLFSDLRGFTSYSEGISPELLVSELNAYLTAMVAEVRREDGLVDKYIGDAIMAVFGLTGDPAESAARALRAAHAMDAALVRHNEARATQGRPPLKHGIGIHSGSVVAGNIGTPERMQWTVIGDVVNLASRLESATKELGVSVIASDAVVQAAQASGLTLPPLESRGGLTVRGHVRPVEVFAISGQALGETG